MTGVSMATAAVPHSAHPATTTGLDHRKIAIWAFIGSECMLFASLISTYLIYKGKSLVGPFPHEACAPPRYATHPNPTLNIPVPSQRVGSQASCGKGPTRLLPL